MLTNDTSRTTTDRTTDAYENIYVLECLYQTYGPDCQQICGNCKNREQCHHVNGSCPNGCDRGIFGEKCDKGTRIQNKSCLILYKLYIYIIIIIHYINYINIY